MKKLWKSKWLTILIAPLVFILGFIYAIDGSDLSLGIFIFLGVIAFKNTFDRIYLNDLIIEKEKKKIVMTGKATGKGSGGGGNKEDKAPL